MNPCYGYRVVEIDCYEVISIEAKFWFSIKNRAYTFMQKRIGRCYTSVHISPAK